MKKISFLLIISVLITTIPNTASAAELLQYNAIQRSYAQQYCMKTDVEGIFQDADGNYAMAVAGTNAKQHMLIPVGRHDVLLTSETSVNSLQSIEGVGQELKNDVIEMAQYAQTYKNYDCDDCSTVSIYSPDLLPMAQNVSYQYYDGHRMKIELLTGDRHAGFTPLVKGNNFKGVLSNIIDVVIDRGVDIPERVSIFGAGVSLLKEILKHASANDVYPSSDNTAEAKIRYSYVRKYTYGELMHLSGDWMVGCMSTSATINEYIFSYDFYTNSGKREAAGEIFIFSNDTKYSENFVSGHLKTAWLNLSHPWADNGISINIGPKTFKLT